MTEETDTSIPDEMATAAGFKVDADPALCSAIQVTHTTYTHTYTHIYTHIQCVCVRVCMSYIHTHTHIRMHTLYCYFAPTVEGALVQLQLVHGQGQF